MRKLLTCILHTATADTPPAALEPPFAGERTTRLGTR